MGKKIMCAMMFMVMISFLGFSGCDDSNGSRPMFPMSDNGSENDEIAKWGSAVWGKDRWNP